MPRVPTEFADLLSKAGRKVLEGRVPALNGVLKTGRRFVTAGGLLEQAKCRALLGTLESALKPHLREMARPIPPESIWGQQYDYEDVLPKTVRTTTVELYPARSAGAAAAERAGVTALLRSDTFRLFASVLSGRKLKRKSGAQVLCYRPGDYAGPHHDHHPQDPEARDGYTDVHVTLCTSAVARQVMVYEESGHFSAQADIAGLGLLTAYRLPFWHYTTPLLAKRGQQARARRWVLLGTFLDA